MLLMSQKRREKKKALHLQQLRHKGRKRLSNNVKRILSDGGKTASSTMFKQNFSLTCECISSDQTGPRIITVHSSVSNQLAASYWEQRFLLAADFSHKQVNWCSVMSDFNDGCWIPSCTTQFQLFSRPIWAWNCPFPACFSSPLLTA